MSNKVAYGIKGSYDLIEELDSGGFGTVWKAEDQSQNKVVVKFPHTTTKKDENDSYLATIKREIKLLEEMVSPPRSIIHFIDKSKDALFPFLVEEYIDGKTLWEKVLLSDNGHGLNALPEKVAAEYLIQIGE